MTDICKLPDKLRNFKFDAPVIGPLYAAGAYDAYKDSAKAIEAGDVSEKGLGIYEELIKKNQRDRESD